jgi:hypothetical protein
MGELVIARDDPAREDVRALLAQHHAYPLAHLHRVFQRVLAKDAHLSRVR